MCHPTDFVFGSRSVFFRKDGLALFNLTTHELHELYYDRPTSYRGIGQTLCSFEHVSCLLSKTFFSYDHSVLASKFSTRKLSYRKDDCAMRPIRECCENFW